MFKKFLISLALLIATSQFHAQANDCAKQFVNGKAPVSTTQKYTQRTTALCFEEYALLYSGETRTPIWTAEFLTNNRIKEARKLKRFDSFHEEDQIPYADRSFLKDYKGSNRASIEDSLDRGHMSPNSDFSTYSAQFESFSLANIIPQNSDNNQVLWEGIESATRKLTTQRERLYVVTGPIFDGNVKKLNGRIAIPSRVFKAIYDPVRHEAGAYITFNRPGMEYQSVSIAELEKITGFNLFPDMSASVKANKMRLPEPTPHRNGSGHERSGAHGRHASSPSADNANSVEQIGKAILSIFK